MMETCSCILLSSNCFSNHLMTNNITKFYHDQISGGSLFRKPTFFYLHKHRLNSMILSVSLEDNVKTELKEENGRRFRWVEIGNDITEEQKLAISKLPFKMENRCKALMRQVICFSPEKGNLSDLLRTWVRIMSPIRADWLSVLKELKTMDHPFYLKVSLIIFHLMSTFLFCIYECL